jgi:hypothetical protein
MFRVAILRFWHAHAQDYAREAEAHPGTEIAAVWDEEARARTRRLARIGRTRDGRIAREAVCGTPEGAGFRVRPR